MSRPASATLAATLTAVVVFPTPPFWLAIAKIVPIGELERRARWRSEAGSPLLVRRPNRFVLPSVLSFQRPLARHSRPARKARRAWGRSCGTRADGGRAPPGKGSTRAGVAGSKAELALPPRQPARSSSLVARSLPCHQRASGPQQRRRVLREHGQRGQRPRGDDVVGLGALARRPLLGPSRDGDARCRRLAAAARRAITSVLRRPDSTRSTCASGSATASTRPGKPAPEPMSATRPGCLAAPRLQAAEAVRHVDVDRRGGLRAPSWADRPPSPGPRASASSRRGASSGQPVALGQPGERFTGNAQDTGRVGVTTSRRSGSSPSL